MKLRWLRSFIGGRRNIKSDACPGLIQHRYKSVSCDEWKNQACNTFSYTADANALAGLYAINSQRNQNGLLINAYPDNFLGVNVGNAFPTDYVANAQDLSHISSAYVGCYNSQQSQNYLNEPTPFFRRLRRSYRAFLSSWRLG